MTRLAGIELEWTPEQKRLIGQISPESTGAVVGVLTDKSKLDGELSNPELLNVLHETNNEILKLLGSAPSASFESVLAIAMAW